MLIDMDTLCIGDPIFELATVYNSYCEFPAIDPEAAAFLGTDVKTCNEIWDKTSKLYYPDADDATLAKVERNAQILGCIRILDYTNRHKDHPAHDRIVEQCLIDINKRVKEII